jgi:D-alanine-D-alanine ligase
MKVALVYNRESKNVINLFGVPNREIMGRNIIKRIADGLKAGGHQVATLEGDKDLVPRLEEFMPRVLKGERPGMVFNISYGIQGQARYTHVPSILEMVGVPYVGSGPLAHSLALDKVVTKMIFRQHGLPTPDFAVLDSPDFVMPDLEFPLIVKPRNEAVSFGLKVVYDEAELREAAGVIFGTFQPSVLAERYIEGREINVGLLGNNPPEALPPVLLRFGEGGPEIYTYEDKMGKSGRQVTLECPAPIGKELVAKSQELAAKAFSVLGCYDCARVDMRLDDDGNLYLLEVNSLPSLGPRGSYVFAAAAAGIDYPALVNRLVDVASARYFGTPHPPLVERRKGTPQELAFSFLTERRDQLERRLEEWVQVSSRTGDPAGIREAVGRTDDLCRELYLSPVKDLTRPPFVSTWETKKGMAGGTLLMLHVDVPVEPSASMTPFRREPEWVYGEGVGLSRAPLVTLEFALRSLRSQRRLRHLPLGVLFYADEGLDCLYSSEVIREATSRVRRVLVLRPGIVDDQVAVQRRGRRIYRLFVEDEPRRPGRYYRKPDVVSWTAGRLDKLTRLTSARDYVSVSTLDLHTRSFNLLQPHEVTATIAVTYLDRRRADALEKKMRTILAEAGPARWTLESVSDRPPMREHKRDTTLAESLKRVAREWEIPLEAKSSVWPSAGGLAPAATAVVCGVGPVAHDLYTPQESVKRISLVQRTLLLAQFLAEGAGG